MENEEFTFCGKLFLKGKFILTCWRIIEKRDIPMENRIFSTTIISIFENSFTNLS